MGIYKGKKNSGEKGGMRLLISVTVVGSAGPIRFVVNEEDMVSAVIDIALKSYAREGRLPVLGSDLNSFVLYCPNHITEALSPKLPIGSVGVRNFSLSKKPPTENATDNGKSPMITRKTSGSWKSWLNKSLNLKISPH